MGRTKPSSGLPPAAFRKDARAKKAKATINKVIPALLSAHPRAREGINRSELITPDLLPPRPLKPAPTRPGPDTPARNPPVPRITLRITDTLTAAHSLLRIATPPSPTPAPTPTPTITPNPNPNTHTSSARRPARYLGLDLDLTNRRARVAILNMASPLCPGGGFLRGAASQEESLCMRTTLLPALRDAFYRLPELGAVYTPDVLVFRAAGEGGGEGGGGGGGGDDGGEGHGDGGGGGGELAKRDRWFVDCVSAAMLRLPEVEVDEDGRAKAYASGKDRVLVRRKMELVMRVFQAKGAKRVVLGAWGCGAYGNPVGEVAAAWREVLLGSKRGAKADAGAGWEGIEEIVFAIKDASLAERFAEAFGDGLVREQEEGDAAPENEEEEEDPETARVKALQDKTKETELSAEQAKSPQLICG